MTDPVAREETAARWGVAELPNRIGRDTAEILEAAHRGELGALVVAGADPDDLPDPARAFEALDAVPFLVSLEQRPTEVTSRADVVLPVAAVVEKSGTFLDWEGRARPFAAALRPDHVATRHLMPDLRVLNMLADAMDVHLGLPDTVSARHELTALGPWERGFAASPAEPGRPLPQAAKGEAVLAGHRMLLDRGTLQTGDEALAGTRHRAVARLSAATAAEAGAADGAPLYVTGPAGTVELPLEITEMPDRVVWLPLNSTGGGVPRDLGTVPGHLVKIAASAPEGAPDSKREVAEEH